MGVLVLKTWLQVLNPPVERCGFISSPMESGELGERGIM